jgi:hypothetical protein
MKKIPGNLISISLRTLVACFLFSLGFTEQSNAQSFDVKVQTRMQYSEDNKQGIRRQLIHEFKKDALKAFMVELPQTKARLIQQHFDEISTFENVDMFFTEFRFKKACNTRTGKQCGEVRDNSLVLMGIATISVNAIDNFLQSKSAIANSAGSSDFAVMFIARKVTDRKTFRAKTTDVSKSESSSSTEITVGGDDTSEVSGGSESSVSVTQQGGSTALKADMFQYDIDLALTESLQSAVTMHLVNAGFEPFAMDDVLYDYDMDGLEELIANDQFSEEGSLSRKVLSGIKKIAAEDGVTFLGIGRVDYRLGEKNNVTGEMSVPATVTVEVFQKKGRRMRAVASVQPTIILGSYPIGGDYTVGQTNAQSKAVQKAMDTVISQLQSKGLF